jgi:uncharacterized protein with FMN-binding domain
VPQSDCSPLKILAVELVIFSRSAWAQLLIALVIAFVMPAICVGQDLVEFLNGTTMEGKILEIRKDAKEFDIESVVGGQKLKRTYPYSKVHAVTWKGKRFELTPIENTKSSQRTQAAQDSGKAKRTKVEVLALIEEAGTTPPDWYASTQLNVPETLDLSWPEKPGEGWNNKKNVGQFIWDIVNPNERRWHSGIKLVHHCMALHADDQQLLNRDMDQLGRMYFTLLQDYARAAFWFQKIGVQADESQGVHLAECYWRLGNKEMALKMMRGKELPPNAVKLLGDMGEIKDALNVAKEYSKTGAASEVFLDAGDALRRANRLDEALKYYQRVLDTDTDRNEEYRQRFRARAREAMEAIQLFDKAEVAKVADGVYRGSSTGYNGPMEVEVKVARGKIIALSVTSHTEKQFYAALTDTPKQIMDKQGIRDIDGTTGATITSQAIVHASARALAQGAK